MQKVDPGMMDNSLAEHMRNRRKWKNFFIKPIYQMKYSWFQMTGGLIFFTVTIVLAYLKMAQVDALMFQNRVIDVATQVQINQLYADVVTIFMIGFAAHILYALNVMLIINHRVSGPTIAIVDIVQQLIKGNYGYKRPLRNHDELVPIHQCVEELSEHLKDKEQVKNDAGENPPS